MTAGRPCTVCGHADRAEIDHALITTRNFVEISRKYAVSQDALARHLTKHVPSDAQRAGAEAVAEAEGLSGAGLTRTASQLLADARAILEEARAAGDLRTAVAGINAAKGCVEMIAKLTGRVDEGVTVNLVLQPAFITLQTVVLDALAPFSEAKAAVANALKRLG